jgi:hypothetical protein
MPDARESTSTSGRVKARRALVILGPLVGLVAIVALLAPRWARERGVDPAPLVGSIGAPSARASASAARLPAGPAELAILAPIVVGSTSKGWKIEAIHAVREGTITVRFVEEKGDGVLDLLVALSSEDGVVPPAIAGRYAVYYEARRVVPEEAERLAKVLARTLEKNQSAPVPPGLAVFAPQPTPRQPL